MQVLRDPGAVLEDGEPLAVRGDPREFDRERGGTGERGRHHADVLGREGGRARFADDSQEADEVLVRDQRDEHRRPGAVEQGRVPGVRDEGRRAVLQQGRQLVRPHSGQVVVPAVAPAPVLVRDDGLWPVHRTHLESAVLGEEQHSGRPPPSAPPPS